MLLSVVPMSVSIFGNFDLNCYFIYVLHNLKYSRYLRLSKTRKCWWFLFSSRLVWYFYSFFYGRRLDYCYDFLNSKHNVILNMCGSLYFFSVWRLCINVILCTSQIYWILRQNKKLTFSYNWRFCCFVKSVAIMLVLLCKILPLVI